MAQKEKFGKFVLLEEQDSSGLGTEYRAAKLGPGGLEKVVNLVRLSASVSGHAEVAKNLMEQAKVAAQLQNPNILKIYGIGKVDSAYYLSYELVEGKSLQAIIHRCRSEGFPFSVDHTLLIASKVCSALEYSHTRKSEGGRYFHGMLTPASVLVSYEGEVRVRGFGQWQSRIKEAGFVRAEESLYLAPEQASGSMAGTRSDIFAVGAILFETLTGRPFFEKGRGIDFRARLAEARLASPTAEDDSLPKAIADILGRALAEEPGARYAEVQEMRKAIDTLLFSGDFTPTTFNLAFFMHSLFREDIELESKALKEDREASYAEYAVEDAKTPAGATGARTIPPVASAPLAAPTPRLELAGGSTTPFEVRSPTPVPASAPAHHPPAASGPVVHEAAPGVPAREAAAGFTFHKAESKSRAPLFGGILILLLALAGGGWYFTKGPGARSSAPTTLVPPPPSLTPEAVAAMAKVKELEEKLQSMEAEKAAAEAKAAEEAKKRLEAQAAARGQVVDPLAVAKAQEEARRKEQAAQEKKLQEERRRLEEEKRAEEARIAEEQRKADEQRRSEEAARVAAVATTTTTLPPPTPAPAPALKPGTLVNLSDVGVIAPVVERKPALQYPPIAHRQKVEGTVELNVLVDEKGNVVDAQVVTAAGGKAGLNEAAVDAVKRYKYRPASKDGVPVKLWMPVRVKFELPR